MVPEPTSNFKAGIFFGSGIKLVSEDDYLDELAAHGITRKGFRAWCRALQVPMLEIGTRRYVDLMSFTLALRAVCRVGQPDFYVPGCDRNTWGVHRKTGGTDKLDPDYFRQNFKVILAELLAARRLSKLSSRGFKQLAKEAANRMVALATQTLPLRLQEQYDTLALRELRRELPFIDIEAVDTEGRPSLSPFSHSAARAHASRRSNSSPAHSGDRIPDGPGDAA